MNKLLNPTDEEIARYLPEERRWVINLVETASSSLETISRALEEPIYVVIPEIEARCLIELYRRLHLPFVISAGNITNRVYIRRVTIESAKYYKRNAYGEVLNVG